MPPQVITVYDTGIDIYFDDNDFQQDVAFDDSDLRIEAVQEVLDKRA